MCIRDSANGVVLDDLRRLDLRSGRAPLRDATVAANLLAPLLLALAEGCSAGAELPRRLIASGLLRGEGEVVASAFAARGLREVKRRASRDWEALLLER